MIPVNLKKNGFVITTSILKSIKAVVFVKVRKNRPITGVIKDSFFNFSFLVPANAEKNGLVITTNTLKTRKEKAFAELVEKDELNTGIKESSFSNSSNFSNSNLEQNIIKFDSGLKLNLLVKTCVSSGIIFQFILKSKMA